MTLPSSPPISLSQVRTELGRTSGTQTTLGETATRTLAGIASGTIRLSNLEGKSNGELAASLGLAASYNYTVNKGGSYCSIQFYISLDGHWYLRSSPDGTNWTTVNSGTWTNTGNTPSNSYEVYVTLSSVVGSFNTVYSVGSWVNINTEPRWAVFASGLNSKGSYTLGVQVRKIGTTTPVLSASTAIAFQDY